MSSIQLSSVAMVFARTTGKKALYLALPLYFVVGTVALILFGGNGMDARYVTALALGSPALRLSLLIGWPCSRCPWRAWC